MPAPQQTAALTATIASGQSLSGAVDLGGYTIFGFAMPAAWDAANLTFAVSPTLAGTYYPLYDADAAEVTVQAAQQRVCSASGADADALASCRFVKVRSGTVGSAVNQTADRVITILCKA